MAIYKDDGMPYSFNFDPEKWKKFLEESISDWAPRVSTNAKKFVYSKGSHGVFHGSQYIGQGVMSSGMLIVERHFDINSEHMKQKDHFALFRNNN